jgi:4-hydroxybenzoate polyprenyltransferase
MTPELVQLSMERSRHQLLRQNAMGSPAAYIFTDAVSNCRYACAARASVVARVNTLALRKTLSVAAALLSKLAVQHAFFWNPLHRGITPWRNRKRTSSRPAEITALEAIGLVNTRKKERMIKTPLKTSDLSDIQFTNWVDRWLPRGWRPYTRLARLDRPVGTWLTLLPCLAALVQAAGGMPDVLRLVVFSLGALIMRSAGSTANDIADRKFDAHVERTRFRPLASGALRTRQALIFLLAELALAAGLLIFLNPLSRWLAVGLLPLVFIYPLCKRFTHWPQVPLGAAFNWGMLMAWSDTQGTIPAGSIVMWLGAITWQVGYDTIYAYVDVADDARLKLRSTAILFAEKGRQWIGGFHAATRALLDTGQMASFHVELVLRRNVDRRLSFGMASMADRRESAGPEFQTVQGEHNDRSDSFCI